MYIVMVFRGRRRGGIPTLLGAFYFWVCIQL
jgi:hypothetical protein